MAKWSAYLFGTPRLQAPGGKVLAVPMPLLTLIGYLATRRERHACRSAVIAALWPEREEEKARHCLATTLWRLKSLAGTKRMPIQAEGDFLTLVPNLWVDSLMFEARLARAKTSDLGALKHLHLATRRYHSSFLDGQFADWILLERERLRCAQIDALLRLACIETEKRNWTAVIASAQQACSMEPLREDAHRLLMTAFAETGNRGLAFKQFQSCKKTLAAELQVEPMPQTIALAKRLMGADENAPASAPLVAMTPCARSMLAESRAAFALALTAFDRAIDLL
jgi:DNA-binding SARP family transcriptional activator